MKKGRMFEEEALEKRESVICAHMSPFGLVRETSALTLFMCDSRWKYNVYKLSLEENISTFYW